MATATAISASGATGDTCQKSGPYKCGRHTSIIIYFRSGQRFPVDPVDGRSTSWSMVGATGTQTAL
jgi:hypothetical protein